MRFLLLRSLIVLFVVLCGLIYLTVLSVIALPHRNEIVAYVDNVSGDRDIFLLDINHNLTINFTTHRQNPTHQRIDDPSIVAVTQYDRLPTDDLLVYDDSMPAWSPDGERMVFHSQRDGISGIYLMGVDGGNMRLLVGGNANYPAWSPDGEHIAFRSNRDGNYELYIINVDGMGLRRLTEQTASDNYPSWSPDGKQIAFQSNLEGNGDIYIINADGTELQQITLHEGEDSVPRWSPDGEYIAFVSRRADNANYQIYLYHLETGEINPLTEDFDSNIHSPVWLPHTDEMIFQSLDGFVSYQRLTYRMDLSDGSYRLLSPDNPFMDMVAWRP